MITAYFVRQKFQSIECIALPCPRGYLANTVFMLVALAFGICPSLICAQDKFENEPILYSKTTPTDEVQQLADLLAVNSDALEWTPEHGYLVAILKALKIPVSSQTLVFSKTSLQVSRITPQTPRAVYFNDNVYVGWVQNGNVIEISAADPKLGATFYSISQKQDDPLAIRRETSRCLQCHGATHTRGRPGHIVRSVFPTDSGLPDYALGTSLVSHQSEFSERFGGWYVTGTHGDLRHRGNSWLPKQETSSLRRNQRDPTDLDIEKGANAQSLEAFIDPTPYLSSHSDIVALMVLQHQVYMHNAITEASYAGQQAVHDTKVMNKVFDRAPDYESESMQRRYDSAAEKLVKALLFCGEAKLQSPIVGTSEFVDEFEKLGPFDSSGRSLREFDLETRMFKYPCSFLIYTDSFKQLPTGIMVRVKTRLKEVLAGDESSEDFEHLSPEDRQSIKTILDETGVLD